MPAFFASPPPLASCTRRVTYPPGTPALAALLLVVALGWAVLGAERALVNLLIAPWLEETLLRLGLQDTLQRRLQQPRWARALDARLATALPPLVCALVFAAAHVLLRPDLLSAATFLPALLIGFAYQRCKALAPCVLLHALLNLLWFASVGFWVFTSSI